MNTFIVDSQEYGEVILFLAEPVDSVEEVKVPENLMPINNIKEATQADIDRLNLPAENEALDKLLKSAEARQAIICDPNKKAELDKAEALVEQGKLTKDQLPKNMAVSIELEEVLWKEYHTRKELIKQGDLSVSTDLSKIGEDLYSYAEVRDERKQALGE